MKEEKYLEQEKGYLEQAKRLMDKIQGKFVVDESVAAELAKQIIFEIAKDRRMEEIERNRNKATTAQRKFLKDLGVKFKKGITREEASELIEKNK